MGTFGTSHFVLYRDHQRLKCTSIIENSPKCVLYREVIIENSPKCVLYREVVLSLEVKMY